MKKVLMVFSMIATLIFTGCLSNDSEKDKGSGVTVVRNGKNVEVIANSDFEAAEFSLNNELKEENVKTEDGILKIVTDNNGVKTLAIASAKDVIKAGEVIFTIESSDKVDVKLTEVASNEGYNLKRGTGDVLLGDFSGNNEVDLKDFMEFAGNYGKTYNAKYDIAPAALGTGAWGTIYCNSTPDGKVGIDDFMIFSKNFSKKKPAESIYAVSITINGASEVKKGENIVLDAVVKYSDNSTKQEDVVWSTVNTDLVALNESSGLPDAMAPWYCKVTGKAKGTAIIKAVKGSIEATKTVTVIETVIVDGIKVHVKGYANIYAWVVEAGKTKELLGAWPGKTMEADTAAGWKIANISNTALGTYETVNVIFNNPGQTSDLTMKKGEWWYDGAWSNTDPDKDTKAPEITATPEAGNQEPSTVTVTLKVTDNKDTAPKAYYTKDGSIPVVGKNEYTTAITLTADAVIKAIAVDASGNTSSIYTFEYKLNRDATPPEVTATPAAGRYETTQYVTLTVKDNRDTAPKIYFTEDGTEPTTSSTLYTVQKITADKTKTIKVLAIDNSGNKKIYPFTYYIGKDIKGDFREETIYFVMTTRFYDGDTANNVHCWDDKQAKNPDTDPAWRGDFKGLIEKLDYIKALGFSAIWVTPPVKNISGYDYHGYHASNFMEIDPRYKSTEDATAEESYRKFIDAAHAKGIKVIQDVVFNHTGNFGEENLHPLFRRNQTSGLNEDINTALTKIAPAGMLPDNYDTLLPGAQFQSRIKAMRAPLDTNVHYHNWDFKGGWEQYEVQLGSIAGDCQDLNTENPEVTKYIRDAYTKWINMGVDAFRVDTVKHISRLTLNKEIVPQLKQAGGENFFMFGEVCTLFSSVWNDGKPAISSPFFTWKESKEYPWGDRVTNEASAQAHWNDNISTAGQPSSNNHALINNTYHAPDWSKRSGLDVIDFTMHHNFASLDGAFRVGVDNDQHYNDATWNVTYVDSHDYGPNAVSLTTRYSGTQGDWAERLNLIFSFRGIPTIYYGSEIEFQKGKPIDVGPNAPLSTTGRAYFGDNIEGTVNASDFGTYTASGKVAETLNYPLAKHIRKLNMMRRAIPALQKGQYSTEGVSGGVAFKRRFTDSAKGIDSFVLVSISGGTTFSGIPNGKYVDAVTGETINVSGGTLTANCSGQGNMRVYVLNGTGIVGDKDAGGYLK